MNRTATICLGIVGVLALVVLLVREGQLVGQVAKEGGEKEKEPRKIHTTGTATVKIKPNRARVYLAVETLASSVKDSRGENKKHAEKIISSIQALKIADLKMKSTNVHMGVLHAKDEKQVKLPEILGYKTTYQFTVLVSSDEPQKLSDMAVKVLDTALENGANTVEQISFFREDLTDAKREALTKATEDAVANAKALAAGDKRTLTDVITIDGNPQYSLPEVSNTMLNQELVGASTSMVAGEVQVTCRVSVTCTFGASK